MAHDAQTIASSFEVLEDALQLLRDRGISRGAYARDRFGEACGSRHPDAEKFCVVGAMIVSAIARNGVDPPDLAPVFALLTPYMDEGKIAHWNDHATDAEILSVLRSAINLERSRLQAVLSV